MPTSKRPASSRRVTDVPRRGRPPNVDADTPAPPHDRRGRSSDNRASGANWRFADRCGGPAVADDLSDFTPADLDYKLEGMRKAMPRLREFFAEGERRPLRVRGGTRGAAGRLEAAGGIGRTLVLERCRPENCYTSFRRRGSCSQRRNPMNPMKELNALETKKKAFSLFEEFKKFAFKGNVVDLAIGVIIGAAFGAIVKSLVEDIIMPLIGLILPGDKGYEGWVWQVGDKNIPYGKFLGAVVNFLIVTLVLYIFIVKFLGWIMRSSKAEAAAPPPPTKDQELLMEIRDLLKQKPAEPAAAPDRGGR
jgi:large conductance mechanosensitive channel